MKKQLIFACLFFTTTLFAQKKKPDNWQTLDPIADNVYGVGAEQAYKTLGTKTSKTVIVAVIDSGVDPNHEDLKSVIWTNPGEIPDNGIDDDHNGYIDDVHGWSFLGGKNGDIGDESTELARLVHKGDKKYAHADVSNMTDSEKKDYEDYKKMKDIFVTDQLQQERQLQGIDMVGGFLDKVKKQNNGVLNKEAFKKYTPQDELEKQLTKNIKLAFT
ncbi:MAG: S8 family serine peptidase, partial [Bacteroidia bacterium]